MYSLTVFQTGNVNPCEFMLWLSGQIIGLYVFRLWRQKYSREGQVQVQLRT